MKTVIVLPPPHIIDEIVRRALAEDIGYGDLTTAAIIPPETTTCGAIIARASGVIAGLPMVEAVFRQLDEASQFDSLVDDGAVIDDGDLIARVSGKGQAILSGERVALNFLQQLSGVATATRQIVEQLEGTEVQLLDTRKTVPGLRALQRYAVRVGGGTNHRFNLFDGILIKENHITVAGGIKTALSQAREASGPFTNIEIEVEDLQQLEEAIATGADLVLLDNMSLDDMRQAVQITAGRVLLEASGDITAATARAIAETGVNFMSAGSITHSPPALNLSLLLDEVG